VHFDGGLDLVILEVLGSIVGLLRLLLKQLFKPALDKGPCRNIFLDRGVILAFDAGPILLTESCQHGPNVLDLLLVL
jgi:hypothetical protein